MLHFLYWHLSEIPSSISLLVTFLWHSTLGIPALLNVSTSFTVFIFFTSPWSLSFLYDSMHFLSVQSLAEIAFFMCNSYELVLKSFFRALLHWLLLSAQRFALFAPGLGEIFHLGFLPHNNSLNSCVIPVIFRTRVLIDIKKNYFVVSVPLTQQDPSMEKLSCHISDLLSSLLAPSLGGIALLK